MLRLLELVFNDLGLGLHVVFQTGFNFLDDFLHVEFVWGESGLLGHNLPLDGHRGPIVLRVFLDQVLRLEFTRFLLKMIMLDIGVSVLQLRYQSSDFIFLFLTFFDEFVVLFTKL